MNKKSKSELPILTEDDFTFDKMKRSVERINNAHLGQPFDDEDIVRIFSCYPLLPAFKVAQETNGGDYDSTLSSIFKLHVLGYLQVEASDVPNEEGKIGLRLVAKEIDQAGFDFLMKAKL